MHRDRMCYAASRRSAQRGVMMRVASEVTAAAAAAACCGAVRAGSADRNHDEMVMEGRAPMGPRRVAAAAHAVAPRHGAINDGEGEVGATAAPNSKIVVDGATVACRWNSCRKIATRCQ
jgi:hypothetical protein